MCGESPNGTCRGYDHDPGEKALGERSITSTPAHLCEDEPDSRSERLARDGECGALVLGHTHTPWIRGHGRVRFVNCGSVGTHDDGDKRAAFAILERVDGEIDARIERVPCDAARVAWEVAAAGLPAVVGDKLMTAD